MADRHAYCLMWHVSTSLSTGHFYSSDLTRGVLEMCNSCWIHIHLQLVLHIWMTMRKHPDWHKALWSTEAFHSFIRLSLNIWRSWDNVYSSAEWREKVQIPLINLTFLWVHETDAARLVSADMNPRSELRETTAVTVATWHLTSQKPWVETEILTATAREKATKERF